MVNHTGAPQALAKLLDLRQVAAEHAAKLTSRISQYTRPPKYLIEASVQTSLIAYLLDEVVLVRTLESCDNISYERIEHLAVNARNALDTFVLAFERPQSQHKAGIMDGG